MFSFITKKPLWVNMLAGMVLVIALVMLFLQLLGLITHHGEYLKVPSVAGLKTDRAIKLLEDRGFEAVLQDSVFSDTAMRGTVLRQLPDPGSMVKVNRIVFLTVNRVTPPPVEMPSLEGKSIGFALDLMRRSHLQLEDTLFRPDFMRGSVLEQLYHGKRIKQGEELPWGSRITLVVGSGLSGEQIEVPGLVGLTYEEAVVLLEQYGLSIGAIIPDPDVTDTASAFVYKQDPPSVNDEKLPVYIQAGQWMDIWLSVDRKTPDEDSNIQ